MPFEILFPTQYQVRFVRTIVGAYNVYFVDHPEEPRKTLSPDRFQSFFPEVSSKTKYGCDTIGYDDIIQLFGEAFEEVLSA
jgi:hypothetical protein